MPRASRTFKLSLSSKGLDALIAAHCHAICATRQLLPWGATLHTAIICLSKRESGEVLRELAQLGTLSLQGGEIFYLGAPPELCEVAADIVTRVSTLDRDGNTPTLMQIYILALACLPRTPVAQVRSAYCSR